MPKNAFLPIFLDITASLLGISGNLLISRSNKSLTRGACSDASTGISIILSPVFLLKSTILCVCLKI